MRGASSQGGGGQDPPKAKKNGRPAVPSWVPAEGRRFVRKLLPELEAKGLLEQLDAGGIAAMASVYGLLALSMRRIEADGIAVADPDHPAKEQSEGAREVRRPAVRKHPLISVVMACNEKLATWSKEFGLTPAARARIFDELEPGRGKGGGKLAAFINKGRSTS